MAQPLSQVSKSLLLRYGGAVAITALATLFKFMLNPVEGARLPFLTYFPAVMFVAWFGRLGPTLLAMALSALAACYFFIPPIYSFNMADKGEQLGLGIFMLVGIVNAALSEAFHRASDRASRNETALRESEKRLATTLMSIGDGVIATDASGLVTFINPVAQSLTGYSQQEAEGRPIKEIFRIVNERSREEVENPVNKVLRDGRVAGLANYTILIAKDGTEAPIDDSGALIRSDEGSISGAVLVFRNITERRRADEAIRKSEERFSKAFNTIPIPIIITRLRDGLIIDANQALLDATGFSRDEVIGCSDQDLNLWTNPSDRDRLMGLVAERGQVSHYEISFRIKSGEVRHNLLSTVRIELGGERCLLAASLDITERKQAEDAAVFLAAIIESSGDAVFAKSLDGTILSWNRGAEKLYGYSIDEVKGQNVSMLAPPEQADEIPRILEQLRDGQFIHNLETVRRKKDGTLIDVALTISPVKDSLGQINAASTIARDITERKQIEREKARLMERIEEQSLRLNNIVTNVPGVVWEAWGQPGESEQRIDFVSDYVEKMLGYSVEDWIGTPNFWLQIVHPEDKERAASEAAAIFMSAKGGTSRFRWMTKDGRALWVEAQSVVILDKAGNPAGMRGVTMDITERKRAEEGESFLAKASKLLSSSLDYEATLASVADLVVPQIADWCAVHIVGDDGQVRQLAVAHADPEKLEWAKQLQQRYPYDANSPTGTSAVLRTGKSKLHTEIPDALLEAAARDQEHLRIIRELGMKSGMVVPMVARGRTLGTITLVTSESRRHYDQADLALAEDLAHRAALAVDNARLYRETEATRGRLSFIAEASALLSASLDYSATLESVSRLAVPEFADWCVVDIVEPDGHINRVTIATANKENRPLLDELRSRYAPTWNSPQPAARALRAGESILLNDLAGEALAATTHDSEHLKIMQELAPHSIIAVPLIARAHTLGAITFALSETAREYTTDDLALAEDLAHRAALAIDNARLYSEVQHALGEREEALKLRDELFKREQAAREEAEAANRMKDEFLATVSHELRTPLNSILGWSHMLRRNKFDEATSARALETIERNAKSQAQLIEDILDVSRIITGRLRLDVQPLELMPIVEAAVEAARPAADAKEINLYTVLDPRAGPISGDPGRLQQVVWNLLSNAVKFTPRGGRVEVRLERAGSQVEIIVRDTGQGIAADFLPHAFDRFRQGDATSTRRHGGLGLGLAIVRHLVEMHGGTIHAESPGDGLGSTFTVRLPLMAAHAEKPDSNRAHPTTGGSYSPDSPPNLEGIKVIVVDDERDTRELLKVIIARYGAEVRTCATSAEAIETLEQWKPDLIISDIEMPGEDGYQLIRKVRSLDGEWGANIPAVALTAYARGEDRVRALSAGYQMHMAKPVEPAELAVVISSLTNREGKTFSGH